MKTCGNAYIMVIFVSFAVLSLVFTALTVTGVSRNITARYENIFGLYDLAVAGNEQVFIFLAQRAQEENVTNPRDVVGLLDGGGQNNFTQRWPGSRMFMREWTLTADFSTMPAGNPANDKFYAVTVVHCCDNETCYLFGQAAHCPTPNSLYIETTIRKYTNGVRGYPATVRSIVAVVRNSLDYYDVEMVQLLRI